MLSPVFAHPSLLLPARLLRSNGEGTRVAVIRDDLVQLIDVRRNSMSAVRLSSSVNDAVWASSVTLAVGCLDGSISLLNALDRSHQSAQPVSRPVIQLTVFNTSLFALYTGQDLYELPLADIKQRPRQFKLRGLSDDPKAFALVRASQRLLITTFGSSAEYLVQFELPPTPTDPSGSSSSLVSRFFRTGASAPAPPVVPLDPRGTLGDPGRAAQSVLVAGQRAYVCDNLGRIAEIDLVLGAVSRLWKGYRQAEVAAMKTCILFLQPRRDEVCEVWSIRDGIRLTVINIPSKSRLLSNGWLLAGDALMSPEIAESQRVADSRRSSRTEEVGPRSAGTSPRTAEALDESTLESLPVPTLLSYHLRRNRHLHSADERRSLADLVLKTLGKSSAGDSERIDLETELLELYVALLTPVVVEADIKRQTWGDTVFGTSLARYFASVSHFDSSSTVSDYLTWLREKLELRGWLNTMQSTPHVFSTSPDLSSSYEAFCRGEAGSLVFSGLLSTSVVSKTARRCADLLYSTDRGRAEALVSYLLCVPLKKLLDERAPVAGLPNPAVVQTLHEFEAGTFLAELAVSCPTSFMPHMALLCAFSGMKKEVDLLTTSLKLSEEDKILPWSLDTEEYVQELSTDVFLRPTVHLFLATRTVSQDLEIHRIQHAISCLNDLGTKNVEVGAIAYFMYKACFEEKLQALTKTRELEALQDLAATVVALLRLALTAKSHQPSTNGSLTPSKIRTLLNSWFFTSVLPTEVKLAYATALALTADPGLSLPASLELKSVPRLVKAIAEQHPMTALEVAELFDLRTLLEVDLLYALVSAFQDWRLDEPGWARKVLQQVAVRCLEERLAFVAQTIGDDLAGSGGVLFAVMRPEEVERLVSLELNEDFVARCEKLNILGVLRSVVLAGSAPHVAAAADVRELVNKARKILESLPDAI